MAGRCDYLHDEVNAERNASASSVAAGGQLFYIDFLPSIEVASILWIRNSIMAACIAGSGL